MTAPVLVADVVQSIVPAGTTQIPPLPTGTPLPGMTPLAELNTSAAAPDENTGTYRLAPAARPETDELAVAIDVFAPEPPVGVLPTETVHACAWTTVETTPVIEVTITRPPDTVNRWPVPEPGSVFGPPVTSAP